MNLPRSALATCWVLATVAAPGRGQFGPDYDLQIMLQTPVAVASILEVVIDDAGTIVFRGQDSAGSGLFRVSAPGAFMRLTPVGPDVYEGLAVRAAAPSFVVTRRHSGAMYTIERWPIAGGGPSILGASPTHFDTPLTFFDVSSTGEIAFWAYVAGQQRLLVGASAPFASAYASAIGVASLLPPSLAEDGRVAFKDNSGHILRANPANGSVTQVTSPASGFTLPLGSPQISHDGQFVAFTGNRGFGAGLVAWTDSASPAAYLHLLGEGLEGLDGGASISVRDFASRANGTDASAWRAVVSGQLSAQSGVYMTSFGVRGAAGGAPYLGGGRPRPIVTQGATIQGSTVASLGGQSRVNANGVVACTVGLTTGSLAIVRATPRGTPDGPPLRVRLAVKRVLGPTGKWNPAWSNRNVERIVARANQTLSSSNFAGVALELAGPIQDLPDPAAIVGGPSWFQLPVTSVASYETTAIANALACGWRTDAINLYLVDSFPANVCGMCSFPGGHPCGGTQEIVFIAPVACGSLTVTDGIALTLVHELGHYFGLPHTFETNCVGPDVPQSCASPFYTGLAPVPGDGIRDTPFDPNSAAGLNVHYGACPPIRELVRQNVMGYLATAPLRATLTLGQVAELRRTALTQRPHVLAP